MMLLIINIDSDISEGIACRRMLSFSPKTLSALAVFRAGRLINQTRHLIGMVTSEVNAFPPYESPNIPLRGAVPESAYQHDNGLRAHCRLLHLIDCAVDR
ncbi:TPA: hypothetical protein SMF53_003750 [Serratia marcescens]|nr:hypothetical protein [Serratia marcescens]